MATCQRSLLGMENKMTNQPIQFQGVPSIPKESISKLLSRVEGSRRPLVEERCLQMPQSCKRTYLRAVTTKAPTIGIRAHCMECVGWVRAEVTQCTALACPLYGYRPFQLGEE